MNKYTNRRDNKNEYKSHSKSVLDTLCEAIHC